jgi:hypothetical protein
MAKLSAEERSEHGRKAILARWNKKKANADLSKEAQR